MQPAGTNTDYIMMLLPEVAGNWTANDGSAPSPTNADIRSGYPPNEVMLMENRPPFFEHQLMRTRRFLVYLIPSDWKAETSKDQWKLCRHSLPSLNSAFHCCCQMFLCSRCAWTVSYGDLRWTTCHIVCDFYRTRTELELFEVNQLAPLQPVRTPAFPTWRKTDPAGNICISRLHL